MRDPSSSDVKAGNATPTVRLGTDSTYQPAAGGRAEELELPVVPASAYKMERELDRGGVGRVVVAEDRRLRRAVAIKELQIGRRDAAPRFVREALVTARLQHPSIVPVYEAGRWPTGEPFYAMKLVSGKSLADLIEAAATVPDRLALLPNMIAVADAVAYAHSEGVIHRDLKPANVMVGSFGETIVIDWGLARDLRGGGDAALSVEQPHPRSGEDTMSGTVLGTPAYMAPEQARGEPVAEPADVYALGAMLYQLLSGLSPYHGLPADQAVARVVAGPPPPVEERCAGLPADLVAITHKAMRRDPAERYPSARELAADLRRFQTGQLVSVVEYSTTRLIQRWVRRHAAAVTVAAVFTVVLLALGALGVSRVVEQRNLARRERLEAKSAQRLAERRSGELVLLQARAALDRDPTASLAWLAELPPDASLAEVRAVAGDALSRGVARHVVRAHDGLVVGLAFSAGWVASAGQSGQLRLVDLDGKAGPPLIDTHGLTTLCTSADRRKLIVADYEGGVRLVDADGGGRRTIQNGASPVLALELSPDGRLLATGDLEGVVRVHDLDGRAPPRVLRGHGSEIRDLVFTPDGTRLASAGFDGTVRLWDLSGEGEGEGKVLVRHGGPVWALAVSPDGRLLASASEDRLIGLLALAGGRAAMLAGHRDGVNALDFAPDGERLASGGKDGEVRLWSRAGDALATLTGHEGPVGRVLFSPDGSVLASASDDKTVRLWRGSGAVRVLRGHEDFVRRLAFSPDGTALASAGQDGTVRIWPVRDEARRVVTGVHAAAGAEHVIAVAGDGGTLVYDAVTGEGRKLADPAPVTTQALSPDGTLLVELGPDRALRVRDVATGAVRLAETLDTDAGSLAATGRLVAAAGYDGTVRLWDLESGARKVWKGHDSYTLAVAFSPDGRKLASAGADRLVQIWDVATGGRRPSPLHAGPVHQVVWSRDGTRLATGDTDGAVRLFDAASFAVLVQHQHRGFARALAVAPDGATVASGGNDRTVRVTRLGEATRVFAGHEQPVLTVAFSPDGGLLASGSADDTVRVWEVATGVARVSRGHAGDVTLVGFDATGASLFSAAADGTLRVTPVAALAPLPAEAAALRAALEAATSARATAAGSAEARD